MNRNYPEVWICGAITRQDGGYHTCNELVQAGEEASHVHRCCCDGDVTKLDWVHIPKPVSRNWQGHWDS